MDNNENVRFTALDIFSGCGGSTTGLKRAGFSVLAAFDNDISAINTYKLNHPEVKTWDCDIRKVDIHSVCKTLGLAEGQLDLLAGCPPCQGFSSLRTLNGNRAIDDERNGLIDEFYKFVKILLPKTVMVENVPALLKDVRFKLFCDQIKHLGYSSAIGIVNAADYGVPQRRRRMIFVASRLGEIKIAEPTKEKNTVFDAIGSLPFPEKSNDPLHNYAVHRSEKVMSLIKKIPHDGGSRQSLGYDGQLECHKKCNGFKDIYGRLKWKSVAPTITSGCTNPSKGRFLHPEQDRALTLREAALLQSFPADYKFTLDRGIGSVALLIGNALPPRLVEKQATNIYQHLISYTM